MSKWLAMALDICTSHNVNSAVSVNSLPNCTKNTNCNLQNIEIFEERAAIIEHEAGLSKEWVEAFAKMDCCEKPKQIPKEQWSMIKNNTGIFLDKFASQTAKCGWSIADIFGVNISAPNTRFDCMGLLILLGNSNVIEVNSEKITIKTTTGAIQNFRKKNLSGHTERINIWELEGRYKNDR